jgi:alkylhydroperoxidase family enzyme
MSDSSLPPPRIEPRAPPYDPDLEALLQRITPPGAPSVLALFRTLAHHPVLAERMTGWGGFLLGRKATLTLRDREIVIGRVCARCGAEYEWGVHVAAFAEAAGLTPEQNTAIADSGAALRQAQGDRDSPLTARDRLLTRMVDELHDSGTVSDALWPQLAALWSTQQLLELLMLAGWYHAIAYVCNAARVPLEPWAPRWQRGTV